MKKLIASAVVVTAITTTVFVAPAKADLIKEAELPCVVTWTASTDKVGPGEDPLFFEQRTASAFAQWQEQSTLAGLDVTFIQQPSVPYDTLVDDGHGLPRTQAINGNITVSFVRNSEVPEADHLPKEELGRGGFDYRESEAGAVWAHGRVGVSVDNYIRFPNTLDSTLLHEIGHAFTLAHVEDKNDLMHALNYGQAGFTEGNRAHLRKAFPACVVGEQQVVAHTQPDCSVKWNKRTTKKKVIRTKVRTCSYGDYETREVLKKKVKKKKR